MHFGFALESSDIDLWNIDLLDTHLDLSDTGIPSKHFVCLQDIFKVSSRHVFEMSWRLLHRNNFSSSKTSSRRLAKCLQDVLKTKKCLLGGYNLNWADYPSNSSRVGACLYCGILYEIDLEPDQDLQKKRSPDF